MTQRPRSAKIPEAAFASVIHAYLASPKFKGLARSTQSGYRQYLRQAELPEVLGAMSVNVIHPADIQLFLDQIADRPGAQISARVALKAVERWAMVRRLLPYPITTGTEVVGSDGGHVPWTDAQVELAQRHARPDIGRAITLAANTGQRGSDLVRMTWADIEKVDGRPGINVVQRKTGLQIWIPMSQDLMAATEAWPRGPYPLLLRADGKPWENRHQMSESWNRHRDSNRALAPCAGLVMHGLRGTAVVRLSRRGATTRQIADMVGMSEAMVARYCRFSLQRANAMAAVHFLDRTGEEQAAKKSARNQKLTD